ncbi:tRNA lysidine(34) synthetase TilS [Pseudooceanicola sp. CBS1P-1]|uniref:tRNA(Ile)-lysidine synthase n=2 Tax=Paracoccaceae TaxID=31989 RepID=A0A6L7G1F4_9RHOB|nr:tRNA lysidine(34) synthetase TilS [Pseudooceanicola endophyticus]MXN17237.1 tRNA lysidine(34) synthetase TilS [Pseudooceanicola albus]
MAGTPQARIAARLGAGNGQVRRLGVAVSGGGDSLALLHLLAGLAPDLGLALQAVTVDHGLRPEARAEAEAVGRSCAQLGLPHAILTWQDWDGQGNLQDQARRARYALMADWARGQGLSQIALGHTADDLAETFLMRLARAAGIDGLSAMSGHVARDGITYLRPMLEIGRAELRHWLGARDLVWAEDPSNEDRGYARVRARDALSALAPAGVSARAIGEAAQNLAAARQALGHYAALEARRLVTADRGDLLIERAGFAALPPEIARRILSGALVWLAGAEYAPRRRPLSQALEAARAGQGMTLHGCTLAGGPARIRITREAAAVAKCRARPGTPWDGRWCLDGPAAQGCEIRALGSDGLRLCPPRLPGGLPARSLAASPAAWRGADLVAAPLAGLGAGWTLTLLRGEDAFHSALLSD